MERLHLQDIIQDMEDNFDYKKYIAEGKLYEAINLDIEDDIAILSGDSGEYEGEIEDGKTSFSIIYDDLDYRISDRYDENNIEGFLGKGHAFVELAKKYDHKWGIERDLVGITIKLKDLAEGRLFEEDFKNPILDKYLELKKSIDYKTVFPTDLQSFVDSLDNTEREGLENDLGLERDELYEGKLKENNKNDYANSEEDYTDEMVIEKIKDIIKYHELDASDVMEEIGQEFGVAFEFGRG